MTCKCKSEIEAKLLERFQGMAAEAKNHEVELTGYTLCIEGNGIVSRGCMNISTTAEFQVKKTGIYKQKKSSAGNMVFTFCPFCGVRYKQEGVPA